MLLTLVSYLFDFLGSYFGAKYFGATKWGTFGAILGALVGLFFGLIGLFVGPVIGAIIGEVIAGKRMIDAGRAGWGSLLGNLGTMLAKLIIALAMIINFSDRRSPHRFESEKRELLPGDLKRCQATALQSACGAKPFPAFLLS